MTTFNSAYVINKFTQELKNYQSRIDITFDDSLDSDNLWNFNNFNDVKNIRNYLDFYYKEAVIKGKCIADIYFDVYKNESRYISAISNSYSAYIDETLTIYKASLKRINDAYQLSESV